MGEQRPDNARRSQSEAPGFYRCVGTAAHGARHGQGGSRNGAEAIRFPAAGRGGNFGPSQGAASETLNGMRDAFDQSMQRRALEQQRIQRLADRLRCRVERAMSQLREEPPAAGSEGQTERMHRLLVLWLNLERAVRSGNSETDRRAPWKSADPEVRQAWDELTSPENQVALERWLCQAAEGRTADWARRALERCRERARKS